MDKKITNGAVNESMTDVYEVMGMKSLREEENVKNIISSSDFKKKLLFDLLNNFDDRKLFTDIDIDSFNNVQGNRFIVKIKFNYLYDNVEYTLTLLVEGDVDDSKKLHQLRLMMVSKWGSFVKFPTLTERIQNGIYNKIIIHNL